MFDYLYSDMTDEMKEQREQSKRENVISKGASVSEHSAKNAGVVGELEEA